jgi:hypothetical protein
MTETHQVTQEQYEFILSQQKKMQERKERKKAQCKKYHLTEKGREAKRKAQRKYWAKKKAQALKN